MSISILESVDITRRCRILNQILFCPMNKSVLAFLLLILLSQFSGPGASFADTPFYQGKTITVVQSTEPGGSGDLRTKAVTGALSKHIPGNPTIMMQYMPGGGGLKAANYMFRTARPDGLTIGRVGPGHVQSAVMRDPGVSFDIDQFIYMGSPDKPLGQCLLHPKGAWFDEPGKAAGCRSIEDRRAVGGTSGLRARTACRVAPRAERTSIRYRLFCAGDASGISAG